MTDSDLRGKYKVTQWVTWQMANQGPKLGECGHFRRAGPEAGDLSYAIRRFTDEANRLYGVLDKRLAANEYLAGGAYSIADIATYPWVARWEWHDMSWSNFPNVDRWFKQLGARPAVQRGMAVP